MYDAEVLIGSLNTVRHNTNKSLQYFNTMNNFFKKSASIFFI